MKPLSGTTVGARSHPQHLGNVVLKNMEVEKTSSGGLGFFGALTIAFIVLKLIGEIDWSWLWVLAPLWIPTLLVLGFLFIIVLFWLIGKTLE